MKTRNRPLEIVFRLRVFSVEVSCLLTGRYRLVGQSIASHVVFEGDLWGETVPEFSHSLGHEQSFKTVISVPRLAQLRPFLSHGWLPKLRAGFATALVRHNPYHPSSAKSYLD